jgi:general secretion pathway protein A
MLRLLTNLETDRHKLLKIILLGQSELASMLARPDLSQINQRITSRYHLDGLQRTDLSCYIRHRITVAGGGRSPLFDKRACGVIYQLTGGIPRLINNLCDRSLLGAYSEGKEQVDQPPRRQPAHRLLLPLAGLLAAALAVGVWLGSFTSEKSPPATAKSTAVENDTAGAVPGNEASASADDAADPLLHSAGKKGENQINIGPITVRETSSDRRDTSAHVVHP